MKLYFLSTLFSIKLPKYYGLFLSCLKFYFSNFSNISSTLLGDIILFSIIHTIIRISEVRSLSDFKINILSVKKRIILSMLESEHSI